MMKLDTVSLLQCFSWTGTAYVYKISFASPYREKYLLPYAVMLVHARISYSYFHF